MSSPVPSIENALRSLRIIHVTLLFSMCLYIVAAEQFGDRAPHDVRTFRSDLIAMGGLLVAISAAVQGRMVHSAGEILQTKPDDSVAMGKW